MKIAVAGYGVEGKVNYSYFGAAYPEAQISIVDEHIDASGAPEGAQLIAGANAFERLDDFDIVIRTAGLSPRKIHTSGKIWSATNEFFEKCPAQIVGVTGTKGKGTTSSLIASILEADGRNVHLVGNIGIPALEILPQIQPDDVVIYELSSFQLWDLERSPHIGVVLMIEPDHLDVHEDMSDYVAAKANIAAHQMEADVLIYHPENQYSSHIANKSVAKKIRYGSDDEGAVRVSSNTFFVQDHAICSVDTLHLVGVHNQDNACAAITAALQLGVSDQAIEKGLSRFRGLDHRLQYVGEASGVRYYDDSIATTPGSAIAAIKSFDQPKILILGGHDKGADYAELADLVARTPSVSRVLLIGSNASSLAERLDVAGAGEKAITLGMVGMSRVVSRASELAKSGDVVVLTPAAASFDQYDSYHDRGNQYKQAVRGLK